MVGVITPAFGGTGVTTATGSGSVVLSSVPTLSNAILNGATTMGTTGMPNISSGSGAPSAVQPNASLYLNYTGTTGSRLYVSNGSTWTAVSGV
jgi:hypothetical protein